MTRGPLVVLRRSRCIIAAVFLILCFLCSSALTQERLKGRSREGTDSYETRSSVVPKLVSLQVVQGSVEQYLDREVLLEGIVTTVNFAPEIRDGSTVSSLVLSEGAASIRVLSPAAILYSEGDRLRVSGIIQRHPSIVGDLELDARDGSFEVLAASERTLDTWIRPRADSSGAVRVESVPTPLSVFGNVSNILSAVIALVATFAIALRFRRFNLALHIAQAGSETWEKRDGTVCVPVRILSTGSSPVALSQNIELRIGRQRIPIKSVHRDLKPVKFPFLVGDERLELMFAVPAKVTFPEDSKVYLRMQDAVSRKKFKKRLPWLDIGLLLVQVRGDANDSPTWPDSGVVMGTDAYFRVRGSDRFHYSKDCAALSRSSVGRIEAIVASEIYALNLSPCKRCRGADIRASRSVREEWGRRRKVTA